MKHASLVLFALLVWLSFRRTFREQVDSTITYDTGAGMETGESWDSVW